jgi:hypothetical protein
MKPESELKIERWFFLAWLLLTIWIIACAFLIQGEYGDGYQTIVNARYFFGDSINYYAQRGPLAAFVLWPIEILVNASALDPLDVRPYHLFSGVLHSAYLLGCWLLLKRAAGNIAARLLAFGGAILTVIFYAYAPYLSHDLLPGLLFLVMIFLCNRWLDRPNTMDATYLVLLGAAVTLIKQTYAIFWVALIAYAVISTLFKWDDGRVTLRKLVILTAQAALSAIISWFFYSLFIAGALPDSPLLTLPIELMTSVVEQYGDEMSGMFSTDLYLRNLHNYGIAAMLLILPSLALAFRGSDARMRLIAVCWLVAAIIMQFVAFREARYLGFLAPLTAMLIVPLVQVLLTRKFSTVALVAIVLLDQYRGMAVGAVQITSTASVNVMRFINASGDAGRVISSNVLSFVYHGDSPLTRDRYHGIYHLTPKLLWGLHEGRVQMGILGGPGDLGLAGIEAGDRVIFANTSIVRHPPWGEDNIPSDIGIFFMIGGHAESMVLVLRNGRYEREDNDGEYVMYVPTAEVGQKLPIVSNSSLTPEIVSAHFGDTGGRDRLQVTGIIVDAMCQADSCDYR